MSPDREIDAALIAATKNKCGSCGMCCKVMNVPEMNKTDGQWCSQFCKGIGCKVYEERPTRCEEFYCLWRLDLLGHDEALRPDRCKVVFAPGAGSPPTITAFVDESRPDAWEKPAIMSIISKLAAQGMPVVVSIGPGLRKRMFMLIDQQKGRPIVGHKWILMSEPDENGVQWYRGDLRR